MPKVEVRHSVFKDCKDLNQLMRREDRKEAEALGLDPFHASFTAYRRGIWRRTATIDDRVAAIWGVAGTPMGNVGQPYLITGSNCTLISPIKFAKIYCKEVKIMTRLFPLLENYVDTKYTGAVRMLKIAGFTLSGPFEFNNNPFYKFTMATK